MNGATLAAEVLGVVFAAGYVVLGVLAVRARLGRIGPGRARVRPERPPGADSGGGPADGAPDSRGDRAGPRSGVRRRRYPV